MADLLWMHTVELIGSPLASLLIGALITWAVSRWYYVRAGRELKTETAELARLSNLLLRFIETHHTGQDTTVQRDASGNATGLVHHAAIHDSMQIGASIISVELTPTQPPKE